MIVLQQPMRHCPSLDINISTFFRHADKSPPKHVKSHMKLYGPDLKFTRFNLHLNDLSLIFQISGEIFRSILINN